MNPVILDGNQCAAAIQAQLSQIVRQLQTNHNITPSLDVLLIGDSAASLSYVSGKKKAAEKVGITGRVHHYPGRYQLAGMLGQIGAYPKPSLLQRGISAIATTRCLVKGGHSGRTPGD